MTMNSLPMLLVGSLALAVVPLLVGMCTSYVKVSIVLGLVKSALGTQNVPGPLVTSVLSLVLTIFVMGPTVKGITSNLMGSDSKSLSKVSVDSIKDLSIKIEPIRDFLTKNSSKIERDQFLSMLKARGVEEKESSLAILIPSFMVSELKESFQMGFLVLLPF